MTNKITMNFTTAIYDNVNNCLKIFSSKKYMI